MADKEILLGVNIDHCATVRQARYKDYETTFGGKVEPDPVAFAYKCECAGCLLYTSPSPRDGLLSRMPSSA